MHVDVPQALSSWQDQNERDNYSHNNKHRNENNITTIKKTVKTIILHMLGLYLSGRNKEFPWQLGEPLVEVSKEFDSLLSTIPDSPKAFH